MRRATLTLSTVTVLALAASGTFAAAAGTSTASIKFSTKKPKTSTGLTVDIRPAPGPDGKAKILSDVKLGLPKGTKLDTTATTACTLTDQQIKDGGGPAKACPPGSKVGTGTADVLLGGNPATFGIQMFNAPSGGKPYLLLDLQLNGSSAYTVAGTLKGSTLDFALTLAESIDARTQHIAFTIKAAGKGKKAYLRTPATCPSTGKLKTTTFLTYTDSADQVKGTIACTKPKKK